VPAKRREENMTRIADYPDERLNDIAWSGTVNPNDFVIRPLVWWARWMEVLMPVLRNGDESLSLNDPKQEYQFDSSTSPHDQPQGGRDLSPPVEQLEEHDRDRAGIAA
jgi:hypothetical protein